MQLAPSRRRRWGRRALVAAAVVVALGVIALVVVARSLDSPWLERRIVAMARAKTGLDVDYVGARVGLGGLTVDELVVKTPAALRDQAPELVHARGLVVSWRLGALVAGTPRVEGLRVASLALTLVRDAAGRTSLSTIEPHGDGKPEPPERQSTPPSKLAADALDGPPPIGRVDVERATVTVLATTAAGARERIAVDGLALHALLARDGAAFAVDAALGSAAAPLVLDVTRTRDGKPAGEARATLSATVTASPRAATARLDLAVERQTLAPDTRVHDAAHVEANAQFGDGRVRVTVSKTLFADGAATLDAALELPDGGAPRIERADGELDLPRLLAIVPSSLVPVEAERARLRYHVAGDSGSVEGELGRVRVHEAQGDLVIDGGKIALHAKPDHGATVVDGKLPLASLTLPGLAANDVDLVVDARLAAGPVVESGSVHARVGTLRAGGPTRATVSDGQVSLRVSHLAIDTREPLATRGAIDVSGSVKSADVSHAATHVITDGTSFSASTKLTGAAPFSLVATTHDDRVRVWTRPGVPPVDTPAELKLDARDVRPDLLAPKKSRGRVHADVTLGALALALDADKAADAVDWKLHADAASLALVRALVPRDASLRAPWDKMSLTLASDGRLEHFAAPSVREHTTLALGHAAVTGANGSIAADRLELDATSNGGVTAHEATVELRTRALTVDGAAQGDAGLSTHARWDGRAQKLSLAVKTSGDKGPLVSVDASAGFDRKRRAVTYDFATHVAQLSSLAPLVHGGAAGFDFDTLAFEVEAKGSLAGLVQSIDERGGVRLAPDPLRTLAADGTLDVAVSGLDWSREDRELAVPHARWHAILATDGDRRILHGTLGADSLTLDVGDHEVEFRDVVDDIEGTVTGDLRAGVAELDHRLAIKTLKQDLVAHYPTGDVSLDLKANRDADGVIHIHQLELANRDAGTTASLKGGLDVGRERRSLSLSGAVTQDLSRAWSAPAEMKGRGKAAVQLRLDSGNLRVYHALAAVRVTGATVELPRAGILVDTMDGEIPLSADLVVDENGARLLRSSSINAYSELRFADQHPLIGRPSFVAIHRVVTPFAVLSPIAGNLRVDDNVVSLNQLELGVRGGRVTGQCIVDWRDDGSTVSLRVRASDVKSSHGEPFDGNVAVTIGTRERTVDGRADILRIGKRHLFDLLDLDDPHHADAAVNRVRRALALGYPDRVRLTFKKGFADAKIDLGGLARLVRIGELHGIPMGPVIDKMLAPLDKKPQAEDEP